MSLQLAIPGELLSSIARFRFANQNHLESQPLVRLQKISERQPSPYSPVSPQGFTALHSADKTRHEAHLSTLR